MQPELDRAGGAVGRELRELAQDIVQEDHYGLLGGPPSEGVVHGIAPELHTHLADGRVRDELGEAHKLEVEGAEGVIGILSGFRNEVANQVRVII